MEVGRVQGNWSEPPQPPFARTALRLALAGAVLAVGVGCNRQHYRQRADKDVEGIISQKNVFPDWQVRNWQVRNVRNLSDSNARELEHRPAERCG